MQQPRLLSGPVNADSRDIPVRESPEKKNGKARRLLGSIATALNSSRTGRYALHSCNKAPATQIRHVKQVLLRK
jgi:hypothetical protein